MYGVSRSDATAARQHIHESFSLVSAVIFRCRSNDPFITRSWLFDLLLFTKLVDPIWAAIAS
jgi:hypothetical protein